MSARLAAAVLALTLPFAIATASADNDMTGKWKIERADDAPWSNDTDYPPYRKVVSDYVGKTVSFEAKHIKGPSLLACADPNYEMKDYPADMLFQGELGESEQRGGGKAEEVATSIGFKTRPIRTLETGCEGAIDFHMSDADHAAFALDNMIYWLVRLKAK
ncbi:MAG: hypothetical protein GC190_00220 [Alphaproteobacteria bacterium]|nr:hypothetical protein [Alphaproteobacteria bacterium]